jgi:phosphatidylinositol glycan class Z
MTGKWRLLLLAALLAKFYFSTQFSYLHPDEFFQSFQILYNNNLPWEVKDKSNINRSIAPLLITHYPAIFFGNKYGLTTSQIYLLTRIQMTAISWFISDWCLYRLIPTKHERIKSFLFVMTSYITLVHQSHTFSNSTETWILLPTLYIINDIRSYLETSKGSISQYSLIKLALLGFLISFGTFNRITFGAWILIPSIYLLKYFIYYPLYGLIPIVIFLLTSYIIVQIDSAYYNTPSFTIAPINNLLYNMSSENLSQHGLHPRFTHILVNYPQLVGPLIFLIFPFNKTYVKTTTFMSVISGFIILSIFPHQELRFLIPAVPLLSTLISFQKPKFNILKKYYKFALPLWIIYTTMLSILYGIFHQAGVVPSIIELNDNILPQTEGTVSLMFWRTYPPPTWMLQDSGKTFDYIAKQNDDSIDWKSIKCSQNYVITMMGVDESTFQDVYDRLNDCSQKVYLITPKNALLAVPTDSYTTEWEDFWHLDLDHFEYDKYGIGTFIPGIGIYKLY